mgnify:CR=1 FL=1
MGFGDHYLLRGAKYGLTDEFVCEEVFFLANIFIQI